MQDQAEKHFNKGVDFAKLGIHAKAVTSFDKALAIEPDNDMLWVLRGYVLDDLGWYAADALASYDKALEIKPDYPVAGYSRGVTLRKLERHPDAVTSFDKAITLNPEYAEAEINRDIALREQAEKRK